MKKFLVPLVILLALGAGIWVGRHWHGTGPAPTASTRKVLFYQSPMHPWINSDQPGNCTICGMKLTPVYEGDTPLDPGQGITVLGSNSIQVLDVASAPVARGALVRTLRVAGTVEDDDTRHRILSAYVDGRIDRLFVNYVGAEVTAGQPLAALYSPPLLTAVREYVSLLRQADRRDPGLLAAARQRLLQLGMIPEQINAAARETTDPATISLVAPMTGTVVTRDVYEGQYVKQGDRLFEIADYSQMWFLCDVYERDLAWIRTGQTVAVTTPSLPGRELTGRITFIDPTVNEATRSAKVRVTLDNPLIDEGGQKRRLLLHRVYAEGRVQVTLPETLLVPRSAVLQAGQEAIVFVVRAPGNYERRTVTLGRVGDDTREVLSGVTDGERVVTQGNLLLDAQTQINHGSGVTPPAVAAPPVMATNVVSMTAEQTVVLRDALTYSADLGAALAADDLPAFTRQAAHVEHRLMPAVTALAGDPAWKPLVTAWTTAATPPPTNSIEAARAWFVPFGMASAAVAREARRSEAFRDVRIYECPMVDDAVPGAPKRAGWIQTAGAKRNPYFGATMPECGAEVKD